MSQTARSESDTVTSAVLQFLKADGERPERGRVSTAGVTTLAEYLRERRRSADPNANRR